MRNRRETLKDAFRVGALLALAGFAPRAALAFNKAAFEAKSMADAARAYGGAAPSESKDVSLTAPEIAENGAVVAMTLGTSLPNVKHLLLLVEKNPNVLVAKFDVSEAVEPQFSTRAKMSQSSDVYAVAITRDGKAFYAKREVKVTLGGCAS